MQFHSTKLQPGAPPPREKENGGGEARKADVLKLRVSNSSFNVILAVVW
jgi:hypothetical protein